MYGMILVEIYSPKWSVALLVDWPVITSQAASDLSVYMVHDHCSLTAAVVTERLQSAHELHNGGLRSTLSQRDG